MAKKKDDLDGLPYTTGGSTTTEQPAKSGGKKGKKGKDKLSKLSLEQLQKRQTQLQGKLKGLKKGDDGFGKFNSSLRRVQQAIARLSQGTTPPATDNPPAVEEEPTHQEIIDRAVEGFFGSNEAERGARAGQQLFEEIVSQPNELKNPYAVEMDQILNNAMNLAGVPDGTLGDPKIQQALNVLLKLSGGLTGDDKQRLYETFTDDANRALQTGLRAGGIGGALSGIGTPGYLGYGAQSAYADSVRKAMRDVAVEDINIRAKAANDYVSQSGNLSGAWLNKFLAAGNLAGSFANFNTDIQKYNNDSLTAWQLADLNAIIQGGQYQDTRADTERAFEIQQTLADKPIPMFEMPEMPFAPGYTPAGYLDPGSGGSSTGGTTGGSTSINSNYNDFDSSGKPYTNSSGSILL